MWCWDRCSSLVEMALWNRVEKYRKTRTDRVCIPLTMARHEKSGENHLDFRCSAPGAPGHWGGVGEGRDDYESLAGCAEPVMKRQNSNPAMMGRHTMNRTGGGRQSQYLAQCWRLRGLLFFTQRRGASAAAQRLQANFRTFENRRRNPSDSGGPAAGGRAVG